MLPEVILRSRLNTADMIIREPDSRTGNVRILKASLDRRRAASRGR